MIKISTNKDALRHEALVYEMMRQSELDGLIAPRYHGLYQSQTGNSAILVVADAGYGLDSVYTDFRLVSQR